jgi:hypothetical protein
MERMTGTASQQSEAVTEYGGSASETTAAAIERAKALCAQVPTERISRLSYAILIAWALVFYTLLVFRLSRICATA